MKSIFETEYNVFYDKVLWTLKLTYECDWPYLLDDGQFIWFGSLDREENEPSRVISSVCDVANDIMYYDFVPSFTAVLSNDEDVPVKFGGINELHAIIDLLRKSDSEVKDYIFSDKSEDRVSAYVEDIWSFKRHGFCAKVDTYEYSRKSGNGSDEAIKSLLDATVSYINAKGKA